MGYDNARFRTLNRYIYLAIVLGLMAVILAVLPNFVGPTLVRRQTSLKLAPEAGLTPAAHLTRPTPTPTPTIRPPTGVGCRRYSVQAGDTLFGLARRFGTTETAIALANNLYVDLLTVGQVLVICGTEVGTQPAEPAPPGGTVPASLGKPVDILMNLTYPAAIHNRKPQWLTLSIALSKTINTAGAGLLPDVAEATTLQPVTLPVPQRPRLPRDQTATLVEHWLSAKLTGSNTTLRSQPLQDSHGLSEMLTSTERMTWQWLFVPPAAGDYLFGVDVFSRGEFELRDATGGMIGTVRSSAQPVWSHEFAVSVDEIFGIPRQWWIIASGLGTVLNLILGLIQLADAAESDIRD